MSNVMAKGENMNMQNTMYPNSTAVSGNDIAYVLGDKQPQRPR